MLLYHPSIKMRIRTGSVWKAFVICSVVWLVISIAFFFVSPHSDMSEWRKEIQRLMSRRLVVPPGDNCTIGTFFDNPIFLQEKQLRDWHFSEYHYCSHNLFVVPSGFARLLNVVFNPHKATGRSGGEEISKWDQQGQQAKLQSEMLSGLKEFCSKSANFATCGINSSSDVSFTDSAVVISAGYPTDANSRYLNVRLGIEYAVGSTLVRLPASVVTDIATKRRESVSDSVGYYVIYINDKFYSIPPPTMANKVIVPMFVLGTLILIIVAMGLRHRQLREQRKQQRSSGGSELKPHPKSASSSQANRDNKIGVSTTDLTANSGNSAGKRKEKANSVALEEHETEGSKKQQQKHKKKSKSKPKSKGNKMEKAAGGAIDWSGGNRAGNENGEFNNVGFEKSINEGDLRARNSGGGAQPSDKQQQQQQQPANQSASNLSEIIQVRSGAASPMAKGQDRAKKPKARKRTGDTEEDTLMDNGVFKAPEGNLTGSERDLSASEDDGVPTLRDSSDQHMI